MSDQFRQRKSVNGKTENTTTEEGRKLDALLDQHGKGAASITATPHSGASIQTLLMVVYVCISVMLLVLFCIRLLNLKKLSRRSPHIHLDDFTLVRTAGQGSAFSFFRWIFWDDDLELDSPEGRRILRHELTVIEPQADPQVIHEYWETNHHSSNTPWSTKLPASKKSDSDCKEYKFSGSRAMLIQQSI